MFGRGHVARDVNRAMMLELFVKEEERTKERARGAREKSQNADSEWGSVLAPIEKI